MPGVIKRTVAGIMWRTKFEFGTVDGKLLADWTMSYADLAASGGEGSICGSGKSAELR